MQELRRQGKITQEELADALGVTRQAIVPLENGKYNALLQLAYKIVRFSDRTIEKALLSEEEETVCGRMRCPLIVQLIPEGDVKEESPLDLHW